MPIIYSETGHNPEWPFSYDPPRHHGEPMPFHPHHHVPLHSSLGMGAGIAEPIDQAVKEWLDNHVNDLSQEILASVRSFYRKYEASYVTTGPTQFIKIPIENYRYADILLVDINGLDLTFNEDYEIRDDYIMLTTPIKEAGQTVHFVSFRAVRIMREDYDLLKGDQGEKGDKGDTFTFDDLTEEQLERLKGDFRAFYRKRLGHHVTTGPNTSIIPIPIDDYSSADILFVNINGLDLNEGVDYVVSDNTIILSTPIEKVGETVSFMSIRAFAIKPEEYDALKGDQGEKGDIGEKGDPGEKGDTFTYDDLTEEQLADLKSGVNSYYRKAEGYYVTTGVTSEIEIPIDGYRPVDILFINVNGLDLVEGRDYSIQGNNVVLSVPIEEADNLVHFVSLRSIEIDSYGYEMLKGERGEKGDKGDKGDPGGVTDYMDLENKPSINSVILDGNLSLEDIGIRVVSNSEIDDIVSG